MHRIFREALDEATGVSQSIIVVMIDIRGFSAFSMRCDSVDAAMFLRRAYIELIDSYFPFSSFYKSTGDGLLLAVPIERKKLLEVSQEVVASCIRCHSEFGNICKDDPMITFKVPDKIGIGIVRGNVCCLISGEKIIDYSGRLLNLTSRLTDLARPSGIVIDGAFNIGLLSEEQRALFKEEKVFLPGIHEEEPIKILYTPEFTSIREYNRKPIRPKRRRVERDTIPYKDTLKMQSITENYKYPLASEPASPDDIKITAEYPAVIKGKVETKYETYSYIDYFEYIMEGHTPSIIINLKKLCEQLKHDKVKKNMEVKILTDYVEK